MSVNASYGYYGPHKFSKGERGRGGRKSRTGEGEEEGIKEQGRVMRGMKAGGLIYSNSLVNLLLNGYIYIYIYILLRAENGDGMKELKKELEESSMRVNAAKAGKLLRDYSPVYKEEFYLPRGSDYNLGSTSDIDGDIGSQIEATSTPHMQKIVPVVDPSIERTNYSNYPTPSPFSTPHKLPSIKYAQKSNTNTKTYRRKAQFYRATEKNNNYLNKSKTTGKYQTEEKSELFNKFHEYLNRTLLKGSQTLGPTQSNTRNIKLKRDISTNENIKYRSTYRNNSICSNISLSDRATNTIYGTINRKTTPDLLPKATPNRLTNLFLQYKYQTNTHPVGRNTLGAANIMDQTITSDEKNHIFRKNWEKLLGQMKHISEKNKHAYGNIQSLEHQSTTKVMNSTMITLGNSEGKSDRSRINQLSCQYLEENKDKELKDMEAAKYKSVNNKFWDKNNMVNKNQEKDENQAEMKGGKTIYETVAESQGVISYMSSKKVKEPYIKLKSIREMFINMQPVSVSKIANKAWEKKLEFCKIDDKYKLNEFLEGEFERLAEQGRSRSPSGTRRQIPRFGRLNTRIPGRKSGKDSPPILHSPTRTMSPPKNKEPKSREESVQRKRTSIASGVNSVKSSSQCATLRSSNDSNRGETSHQIHKHHPDNRILELIGPADDPITPKIHRKKSKGTENRGEYLLETEENPLTEELFGEISQRVEEILQGEGEENAQLDTVATVREKCKKHYNLKKNIKWNLLNNLDSIGNQRPVTLRLKQKYLHKLQNSPGVDNYLVSNPEDAFSIYYILYI